MDLPDPTLYAIPFFLLTLAGEAWWSTRRKNLRYTKTDTITSLSLGIGSLISGALTGGLVLAMAVWVYQFHIFEIGFIWWAWPLCFVLDDLAYYVFHRSAHRVRWFWAAHVVHHSSEHYNLSTALRQTWTGFLAIGFIFRMPLFLIGFPVEMVLFVVGINLIYQYWIHTEAIDRMPKWFEAVMNTPSHHRVHHATNPVYLDKNFAGALIIWDRMFRTFIAESGPDTGQEKIRYGIVHPLENNNIFWAAFHEWVGIARDIWSAPWRAKLNYLIAPPGWSHDGSRETSEQIKARFQAEKGTEENTPSRPELLSD